jgi:ABC-type nitrate/sulfonate/bicarbonate transport system substrate-binding protein
MRYIDRRRDGIMSLRYDSGTVVGPEFRSKITQLGLNILADLRTVKIPWEQDALVTSRKFLETKGDVVERVMKALLQANAYVLNPANRSSVVELLRTRLGLKTTQEAEGAYEDLTRFYVLKKPFPYRDGLQSIYCRSRQGCAEGSLALLV